MRAIATTSLKISQHMKISYGVMWTSRADRTGVPQKGTKPYRFGNCHFFPQTHARNVKNLICNPQAICLAGSSTSRLGKIKNGNAYSLPAYSCAGLFRVWSQKSIQRHCPTRYLTQPLGEPKGRLFATGEDVAQVRVRTFSRFGYLFDG